jgi:hypothetical protein
MVYQYDIETRQEEYNPDDYRKDVAFQKWKQMCQEEPRTDWNMWMNIKKVVQAGVESERSRHEKELEELKDRFCAWNCPVYDDSQIKKCRDNDIMCEDGKRVFGCEKKQ